jgi:hypothetical protein
MAASPFPPPGPEVGGPLASLAWVWDWIWPALSSAFGAGAMWGITRATAVDHDRRLNRLEETVPAALQAIGDKIDDNHRETMRMIVTLARHSGRED